MHRRRCEGMTRLTDASVIRALARKEKLEREIELHGRAIETPQRELEERQIELHDLDTFLELYARFSEDDDLHGDEDITGTANQQPDAPEFVEEDFLVMVLFLENNSKRILVRYCLSMATNEERQIIKKFRSSGLRVGGTNELKFWSKNLERQTCIH